MMIPGYIEERLRQAPPEMIVPGSTPVIAFGDFRTATVATLGWNPSNREFQDTNCRELVGSARRLESLASLNVTTLQTAAVPTLQRVIELTEIALPGRPRLYTGRDHRGMQVLGWNLNLQSSPGVSNQEIELIASCCSGPLARPRLRDLS